MGIMWRYEPDDFDENGNRKDGKDAPEGHRASRQLKDYIPSAGKGFENHSVDDNGESVPEKELPKPSYPPLNKRTWDH